MANFTKFWIGGAAIAALTGSIAVTGLAAGAGGDNTPWINKGYCKTFRAPDVPAALTKKNVHIIGVDMGTQGEILRMKVRPEILAALPDNFTFSERREFLGGLGRADFIPDTGRWPDWVKTPLDTGSLDDAAFIYVLLPETWTYSQTPLSLKTPAKRWLHPFVMLPETALTPKAAILHRQAQNLPEHQKCRYEYNLHVTISQTLGGKPMQTDIIIDPGSSNNPSPPFGTEN